MVTYDAQTLLNRRKFTVHFPCASKGVKAWIAMQLVGLAVTIVGSVFTNPTVE